MGNLNPSRHSSREDGTGRQENIGQLLNEFRDKISPKHKGERWENVRIELVKRDLAFVSSTEVRKSS